MLNFHQLLVLLYELLKINKILHMNAQQVSKKIYTSLQKIYTI